MKKEAPLGSFEQLVLGSVLMLGERAYGMAIHEKVTQLGDRPIRLGAIYMTLDRLVDKGYLSSWLTDPTPERGGRSKRCYKLLAAGERALKDASATAGRLHEGVEQSRGFLKWEPKRAK